MILQVHDLHTELKQKIRATANVDMYALRLHLYRHLLPAGSLSVELRNSSNVLIKSSALMPISSIPHTQNYFHGYVRFILEYPLREGLEYFIALKSTGYTYSGSAFIGWCNDFDLKRVDSNYAPNAGISAPLGLELWAYEMTRRRTS